MPPDGILNFTSVTIPAGVTVTFNKNALDTPVFLAATGDVLIDGTVRVSAGGTTRIGGPGAGVGGVRGDAVPDGTAGTGLSPGAGGIGRTEFSALGRAGGGGGMATDGLTSTSRTGGSPGLGGPAVPFPAILTGGSGGGGGGRGRFFNVNLSGGDGGGGGGALEISALGNVTIGGAIEANGSFQTTSIPARRA